MILNNVIPHRVFLMPVLSVAIFSSLPLLSRPTEKTKRYIIRISSFTLVFAIGSSSVFGVQPTKRFRQRSQQKSQRFPPATVHLHHLLCFLNGIPKANLFVRHINEWDKPAKTTLLRRSARKSKREEAGRQLVTSARRGWLWFHPMPITPSITVSRREMPIRLNERQQANVKVRTEAHRSRNKCINIECIFVSMFNEHIHYSMLQVDRAQWRVGGIASSDWLGDYIENEENLGNNIMISLWSL